MRLRKYLVRLADQIFSYYLILKSNFQVFLTLETLLNKEENIKCCYGKIIISRLEQIGKYVPSECS